MSKKVTNQKKNAKNKTKKRGNFIVEVFKEFSIITWPTGSEFRKTSLTVLVFVAIYIAYISLLDFGSKSLFNFLFNR